MNALLLMLATIPPYAGVVPATYPDDVLHAAAAVQQMYAESRGRIDAAIAANPMIEVDRESLVQLYARASKMEWQHRPLMEPDIMPDGKQREDADKNPLWRPVLKNGEQVYVREYTGGPIESRKTWLWTHDSDPRDCWRAALALKAIADKIGGQR